MANSSQTLQMFSTLQSTTEPHNLDWNCNSGRGGLQPQPGPSLTRSATLHKESESSSKMSTVRGPGGVAHTRRTSCSVFLRAFSWATRNPSGALSSGTPKRPWNPKKSSHWEQSTWTGGIINTFLIHKISAFIGISYHHDNCHHRYPSHIPRDVPRTRHWNGIFLQFLFYRKQTNKKKQNDTHSKSSSVTTTEQPGLHDTHF